MEALSVEPLPTAQGLEDRRIIQGWKAVDDDGGTFLFLFETSFQ